MKFVDIISDRDFNYLTADISTTNRAACWELWRDDLTTQMTPTQLIHGANSILTYFGSQRKITDVQWDDQGNCFLWEVHYDQLC